MTYIITVETIVSDDVLTYKCCSEVTHGNNTCTSGKFNLVEYNQNEKRAIVVERAWDPSVIAKP